MKLSRSVSKRKVKASEVTQKILKNVSHVPGSTLSLVSPNKPEVPDASESAPRIWCLQLAYFLIHISLVTLVIFSAEMVGSAVEQLSEGQKPLTIWQSIYFTLITVSSVGYGDVVCATNFGRIATALVIAFTILTYNIKSYELDRSMKTHGHRDLTIHHMLQSRVEPNLSSKPNPVLVSNMKKATSNLDHLNRRIDTAIEMLETLDKQVKLLTKMGRNDSSRSAPSIYNNIEQSN